MVVLAGFLELLLGAFKLGELAKYIPFPVVSGQLNGLAFLLIASQLRPLLGLSRESALFSSWEAILPLNLLVGLVTLGVILLSEKLSKKLPAALVGIVAGSLFYYILVSLGHQASLGPTIGQAPSGFPTPRFAPQILEAAFHPEWRPVLISQIPVAFGVAALLSLGTLLSILVVDKHTGERSDSSRELMAQGAGNMAAALFGNAAVVVGFSGVPIANYDNGGRTRLSRVIAGLFGLVVLVALGPLIGKVPQVVFAGTLFYIGMTMVDKWSFSLVPKLFSSKERTPAVILDLGIVVLVAGIIIGVSILHGVAVGIALSCMLFVVRMSHKTIRRQFCGSAIRANVDRGGEELELLDQSGGRIQVLELEGALFFGAADKLGMQLEQIVDEGCDIIVVDLKRVTDVDSTGAMALAQVLDRARAQGSDIVLGSIGPDHVFRNQASHTGIIDALGEDHCFPTLDDAFSWAEDRLLDKVLGSDRYQNELPLGSVEVLRSLSSEFLEEFKGYCERRQFEDGEIVFREGDPGDEVLLVLSGRIDLFRASVTGDERRIMTLCPGTVCGEMAIIDGGPRSATARASGSLGCFSLPQHRLLEMREKSPALAARFFEGLSKLLSVRLRVANKLNLELRV